MSTDTPTPPGPEHTGPGHTGPPGTTLTARSSGDLVALAPISLGFVPEESLVMLSFGGGRSCHARIDLPADLTEVPEAVEALLRPARLHRLGAVAFVLYGDDPVLAGALGGRLVRCFTGAAVDVVDVLRVEGGRWFAVLPGHPPAHYDGVPFDLDSHPLTAAAVVAGRVRRGSREEVRASIAPDVSAVRLTQRALGSGAGRSIAADRVSEVVAGHLARGSTCEVPELVGLARAVVVESVRGRLWPHLRRANAHDHVAFWSDVVRRLPASLVAAPAALLALAAWVAGDGALAWCAVDRCLEAEPEHGLGLLVGDLLQGAVAPHEWDRIADRSGPDGPLDGAA